MVTKDDVLGAFTALELAGLRPPQKWLASEDDLNGAVAIWQQVLADMTGTELRRAIVAYLRSDKAAFWPMPGQLLHLAKPAEIDDGDLAWGKLGCLIRRFGSYSPPATSNTEGTWVLDDDPQRRAAMEAGLEALGGWRQACGSMRENEDNAPMRASFRAAYRAHRQRAMQTRESETVRAILEGTNLGHLLAPPEPEPVVRQPLQIAAEGGRVLSPEERAERMRQHERWMEERRAAIRQIGRSVKDGPDA